MKVNELPAVDMIDISYEEFKNMESSRRYPKIYKCPVSGKPQWFDVKEVRERMTEEHWEYTVFYTCNKCCNVWKG